MNPRVILLAAVVVVGSGLAIRSWLGADDAPGEGGGPPTVEIDDPPPDPELPGPREGIAGVMGFHVVSKVVYPAQPDTPHRRELRHVFPDRTHEKLSIPGTGRTNRIITRRFGELVWRQEIGKGESQPVEGDLRLATLRSYGLRLAVTMWPDGFDWREVDGGLRADLGALGHLVARLEGERPTRIAVFAADGPEEEALGDFEWHELRGRTWPWRMSLSIDGALVWTEEVESLEPDPGVIDGFFLPAERRDLADVARTLSVAAEARLPGTTWLRVPIEGDLDWKGALELASADAARIAPGLARAGLELDPVWTFELDRGARPTAIVHVLATQPATTPAGWERSPSRLGFAAFVDDLEGVGPGHLEALRRRAAKAGGRPGTPHMRVMSVDATGEGPVARLILPADGPP